MSLLGSLGKALAFTVSPVTWVAARGVELVTGKDDIVRNNPLTYFSDIFTGGDKPPAAPAGGAAQAAAGTGLANYPVAPTGPMDYEAAMMEINKLAAGGK